MEVQTQAEIAIRLRFMSAEASHAIVALTDEVGRMLSGLINALERKA